MKHRRVIKLTSNWSPNVSIEAIINLERNKAFDKSWEHDCNYFSLVTDAPIETTIYPKRYKGWSQWSKSAWAYFSAMNEDPNESIINLERKKGLNENSQSDWTYFWIRHRCFNWDKDLYNDKTKDWMKNRRDRTYFSLVIDVSMKPSIYSARNKRVH